MLCSIRFDFYQFNSQQKFHRKHPKTFKFLLTLKINLFVFILTAICCAQRRAGVLRAQIHTSFQFTYFQKLFLNPGSVERCGFSPEHSTNI